MNAEKLYRVEQVGLPLLAAVPLLFTFVVSPIAVALFALMMGGLLAGILIDRRFSMPAPVLALLGILYLFFFPFDALFISRGLVGPCSHLLFFIAWYQTIESEWRDNDAQRILVSFLIFVTAAATSTHWSIILYVGLFGLLAYRELMQISWSSSSAELTDQVVAPLAPRTRTAVLIGTASVLIGIVMFPLLPRVRDPYVRGLPSLSATQSTGISDEIDFRDERFGSSDAEVVARVWPERNGGAFLPIRLRASVYDAWDDGKWVSKRRQIGMVSEGGAQTWIIGNPHGPEGSFRVQQRRSNDQRVFSPTDTWKIEGLRYAHGTRHPGVVAAEELRQRPIDYTATVAREVSSFRDESPRLVQYPITPAIVRMAVEVTSASVEPLVAAEAVENYLVSNFEYVSNVSEQGEIFSVDQFLLDKQRGHCEYFAAGMVVLLAAVDVPARIVGGFYGGEENGLGGYYVVRKSDAHAWVEVWDGDRWKTFDPTPPDLRPGAGAKSALAQLGAAVDSISYIWDRWILTYGASDQISITQQALEAVQSVMAGASGSLELVRPLVLVFPVVGGIWLVILLLRAYQGRRKDPYLEMLRILERLGFEFGISMTGRDVGRAVQLRSPDLALLVRPVLQYQELEQFSPTPPDETLRQRVAESLSRLRAV